MFGTTVCDQHYVHELMQISLFIIKEYKLTKL